MRVTKNIASCIWRVRRQVAGMKCFFLREKRIASIITKCTSFCSGHRYVSVSALGDVVYCNSLNGTMLI